MESCYGNGGSLSRRTSTVQSLRKTRAETSEKRDKLMAKQRQKRMPKREREQTIAEPDRDGARLVRDRSPGKFSQNEHKRLQSMSDTSHVVRFTGIRKPGEYHY